MKIFKREIFTLTQPTIISIKYFEKPTNNRKLFSKVSQYAAIISVRTFRDNGLMLLPPYPGRESTYLLSCLYRVVLKLTRVATPPCNAEHPVLNFQECKVHLEHMHKIWTTLTVEIFVILLVFDFLITAKHKLFLKIIVKSLKLLSGNKYCWFLFEIYYKLGYWHILSKKTPFVTLWHCGRFFCKGQNIVSLILW